MGQGHLKDIETSELWTSDHMIHQSDFPHAHSLHQSHKFAFSYNWLVPFHKTQLKINLFIYCNIVWSRQFSSCDFGENLQLRKLSLLR